MIPASVRADGTVRREIRVKPGYRPPEDVEVYKNRTAEAWKNRGSGGIPGLAPVSDSKTGGGDSVVVNSKNAKRRAARKKAKEGGTAEEGAATATGEMVADTKEKSESTTAAAEKTKTPTATTMDADDATDAASSKAKTEATPEYKEKQAKAIRKKIRQAGDLKNRKEGGENLLPEQLDKIIKMNELMRQLKALGFDE